ncbi:MAG: hypothetical protein AB7H85_05805 [Dehalococcoidia bacterium]
MRAGFRAAAGDVRFDPWRPQVWTLTGIAAVLLGLITGLLLALFIDRGTLADYRYHVWRWEADTLFSNVSARIGLAPEPDMAAAEEAVQNYFRITSELRGAMDQTPADAALVAALSNERGVYENDVERFIEGRIEDAVAAAGLQRSLPLFSEVRITWPPVDFELTTPPQLLVRSPRSEIKRDGDTLLKPGLTFEQVEQIEGRADDEDTVSIVVSIGGLAAYPAIVAANRTYDGLLDTTSHEWVHHYLAFYPLGQQWGKGGNAETLNETTANIAGREIARLVREAQPVALNPDEDGRRPARAGATAVTIDFNKEMRELRLEVDSLLADGKVEEAEAEMSAKRQFFEDNGIFIRKLNQAYFAFYGTYADSAASSNPVGPKIERVWELTGDVGRFLAVMRDVTNVEDLDEALAKLER